MGIQVLQSVYTLDVYGPSGARAPLLAFGPLGLQISMINDQICFFGEGEQ